MKTSFKKKSMLTLLEYTPEEVLQLIQFAIQLKVEKQKRIFKKRLKNQNIALIFQKPSTRTRISASVACSDEGAYSEYFNKNDIHLGKKESLKDSARVFGRIFDGIVFRGFNQKDLMALSQYAGIPVWNGLTDQHHPTQILADLMTIYEKYNRLSGVRVTYMGDARNNTAQSLMIGAAKTGLHLTLCCPPTLAPHAELLQMCEILSQDTQAKIKIEYQPQTAVHHTDVIYTDVWVSMGEEQLPDLNQRMKTLIPYQVNDEILKMTENPNVVFMHCLPANKGKEVTESVFESPRSLVFDESENKLHAFKAVFISSLTGVLE